MSIDVRLQAECDTSFAICMVMTAILFLPTMKKDARVLALVVADIKCKDMFLLLQKKFVPGSHALLKPS